MDGWYPFFNPAQGRSDGEYVHTRARMRSRLVAARQTETQRLRDIEATDRSLFRRRWIRVGRRLLPSDHPDAPPQIVGGRTRAQHITRNYTQAVDSMLHRSRIAYGPYVYEFRVNYLKMCLEVLRQSRNRLPVAYLQQLSFWEQEFRRVHNAYQKAQYQLLDMEYPKVWNSI